MSVTFNGNLWNNEGDSDNWGHGLDLPEPQVLHQYTGTIIHQQSFGAELRKHIGNAGGLAG